MCCDKNERLQAIAASYEQIIYDLQEEIEHLEDEIQKLKEKEK